MRAPPPTRSSAPSACSSSSSGDSARAVRGSAADRARPARRADQSRPGLRAAGQGRSRARRAAPRADGRSVAGAAAASTWAGVPGVPVAASVKFALLLIDRGAVADAIGILERRQGDEPAVLRGVVQPGERLRPQPRTGARARGVRRRAGGHARRAAGLASGGRDRRAAGAAGAGAVLLDSREAGRPGRSRRPPRLRPRLLDDGPARGRGAGAREGGAAASGRPVAPIHAGRRRRSASGSSTPRSGSSSRWCAARPEDPRAPVRARRRPLHARDTSTTPRST